MGPPKRTHTLCGHLPHYGKGLCHSCYDKKNIKRKREVSLASYNRVQYGVEPHQTKRLKKQACSICKRRKKKMVFDHDHSLPKGQYRGVLCCFCNVRLGWFETFKESIERYLDKN